MLSPPQEINEAFEELEEGNEDAMKNEFDRQVRPPKSCLYPPTT